MPLSTEKPLQHESASEFRRGETDAALAVPGAKEPKVADDNRDSKQDASGTFGDRQRDARFTTERQSDSQGSYSAGYSERGVENAQYSGTTQRYDATLPATIIVEREKEPTRTIVEYQQQAPEYSQGHRGVAEGQTFEQSIIEGHHRHHQPKVEREHEGLFYRPSEGDEDRRQVGTGSAVPLSSQSTHHQDADRTAASYASMEGSDSRQQGRRHSDDARLEEQGKHFEGIMEQEAKDEQSFEAGRESMRSYATGSYATGGSPTHHHHHHHHHSSSHHSRHEDERGAGSVRSSNVAATNRRDDNVSNPNPNTTGGQAGNKHCTDGGATSGKDSTAPIPSTGLPQATGAAATGATGLPKEGGATGATGTTGLPKEGGTTGASTLPNEGTAPDKPKDTTSPTAKPGSSLNKETDKNKIGLPKSNVPPADKAPVDAKTDAEKKGLPGAAPTTTVPSGKGPAGAAPITGAPGVPPGSTAPLPPPGAPAGSSGDLEKDKDEEEHHGMKGKMHDMKEKMKDALHIGHHDKEKPKDDKLQGGPVTDSHG